LHLEKRVPIRDAMGRAIVAGFVEEIRDLKNIRFLVLRDRSGTLQVTAKKGEVPEEVFSQIASLTKESVVCAEGLIVESPIAKLGKELIPSKLHVLSRAGAPLPIDFLHPEVVKTSLDKRLDYRFLDLRSPRSCAIFRVQDALSDAIHRFFKEEGFIEIHTSKLVAQATESGANVFKVDYFGRDAYLAQSPQFYKQMMMAAGFERVFEIGPVFRAEKHHTPRHLCEYTSIDFEMSYISGPEDVMRVLEKLVIFAIEEVLRRCKGELDLLKAKVEVPKAPFPKITLREAYKILEERNLKVPYMEDLGPEDERLIASIIKERTGSDFFFLTEYAWAPNSRPFYVMRKEEEPDWTYAFDLFYKGLELTTGGQREHRYEKLREQCALKGLEPEAFRFYLDFFKYGMPPHGGSGTGLERFTMQLLNLSNIREATLLPRDPERLTP
jgi:nondiscriminating aspartyl-tRNA synthetase